MHEFDDAPGDAEGFAFFGFAGLGIISWCAGAWPVAVACSVVAVLAVVAASVGRNAERQDRADRLGPKGEHAVPEGQTPQQLPPNTGGSHG